MGVRCQGSLAAEPNLGEHLADLAARGSENVRATLVLDLHWLRSPGLVYPVDVEVARIGFSLSST